LCCWFNALQIWAGFWGEANLDVREEGAIFYRFARLTMATRREKHALTLSAKASQIEAVEPSGLRDLARIPPARTPTQDVEEFFELAVEEIAVLRSRAELEEIERAADLILECEVRGGRVHVTGIGKSEHIARYVASLFSSTGTPAYFLHATECVHGSAGQVCASDVVIAISNSGTTPELLHAVDVLQDFGVKILAVSGNRESALARRADVLLYSGVENEGGALNLVPRASILAKILVLCGLSVALEAHKGLTREQYARLHPGGALGRLARGE
jgi:D-arabinose 5-phosphate isomerase GutQ